MIELLPCPFCGGEAKADSSFIEGVTALNNKTEWVICEQCGAHTNYYSDGDDAEDAWNRRTTPLASGIPEGYALVPIEPTDEMLSAAHWEVVLGIDSADKPVYLSKVEARTAYKAMLASTQSAKAEGISD